MDTNRAQLTYLFENNLIDIQKGVVFEEALPPVRSSCTFERIEGMMLGLAIGDSLGKTTESLPPHVRKSRHGEIRNYLPIAYANNEARGLPSDDTQLSFWTLEQMIADRGFNPDNVSRRFCAGHIFGMGGTVKQFIANRRAGLKWYACGVKSAGNGALMRIAPMLIPHIKAGGTGVWTDTALSAMLTHNDSGSIACCVSFVNLLWHVLQMDSVPEPWWWLDEYVRIARQLEKDFNYRPRFGRYVDYTGSIWQFVDTTVRDTFSKNTPTLDACNAWGSGAFLLETMPSVIYILMKHGSRFEEAVVSAVNDTKIIGDLRNLLNVMYAVDPATVANSFTIAEHCQALIYIKVAYGTSPTNCFVKVRPAIH